MISAATVGYIALAAFVFVMLGVIGTRKSSRDFYVDPEKFTTLEAQRAEQQRLEDQEQLDYLAARAAKKANKES